jgi:hypothetical protein
MANAESGRTKAWKRMETVRTLKGIADWDSHFNKSIRKVLSSENGEDLELNLLQSSMSATATLIFWKIKYLKKAARPKPRAKNE